LNIQFQVLEGPHKGQNLWTKLNLVHENAKTVQFAQAELSAICRALGIERIKDSQELHNLPLILEVKVENRQDKPGELANRIKGYKPKNGNTSHQAPAPGNGSTPPWAKKAS
jgi:Protein of unknown function (DUF669)